MKQKIMKNIVKKDSLLFLGIGILMGLSIFIFYFLVNDNGNNSVYPHNKSQALIQQLKEGDKCPVDLVDEFANARISFLPVSIPEKDRIPPDHEVIGTAFDPVELGEDLYNHGQYEGGSPWYVEEMKISSPDYEDVQVYYGNIAMTKGPHVAYVVKDDIVIFMASGAGIEIDASTPNGMEVSESIVDGSLGKYKRTKYEYIDGEFIPVWYQISCNIAN